MATDKEDIVMNNNSIKLEKDNIATTGGNIESEYNKIFLEYLK